MAGSERTTIGDHFHFFRMWMSKPVLTGAVSPSGPGLSRAMAAGADPSRDLPVLELGPGTGPVTEALIRRGFAPEKIVAVEFNPDFATLLADRFRGLNVVEGDAYDLDATLPAELSGPYSAVISSLPLLTRPPEVRRALIESALARVDGNGGLIQFSYGMKPPVLATAGRFGVERTAFVALNIPPARVWRYRRAL